ncbi:hypothetical protein M9Y10_008217 [Tritrichomonas musculus]|uniref:Viral A-type inclusion protein n=1 Tax=Tritrichomonas musculus TaxID=1915356 RepID=A0ABR2IZB5_9EUKA
MSNYSKKAQQDQTIFTLMDSQLINKQPYTDLSNFLSSHKKHQSNYTPEEFEEAQTLTNQLVKSVCQFLLGKGESNVLQLLNQSLSLYPSVSNKNSNRQKDPLSPHGALNHQFDDSDFENNKNDSERNDDDDDIIDRIAEQLKIETPTTEENLVDTISNKLNQAEKLKANLIKTFGLPKGTQEKGIISALNEKFGENNQYNSSDENLRIQLSQLSKELADAQKQMHSLRSNEQQKNLTILELQNKITELQNTEIMNDISAEIVDNKIDLARYKNDITTLKSENAKLIKFKTKAQKKNAELQRILKGYQDKIKALAQRNEDLQKEISDQKEKDQLDDLQSNSEIDKKDDLQFPFDQLLDQYEKQSKEIYEESALRMELLDSVQKLMSINTILDQKLQQATTRINELESIRDNMFKEQAEIKQQLMSRSIGNLEGTENGLNSDNLNNDSSISNESKETVDESLIEHLKEIIQSANDSLRDTLSGIVENPDFTISKRVLSVVSTLVNSIQHAESYDENPEVLEQRNQLLLSTVSSLMQFFNDMIRSQEIRSWAFTQYSFEESKTLLISQVQSIQQFMKENCIQYLENENTILSSFVERNDPLQLEQSIKRILTPYEKVRTNEGKDLLILLHQSLAAGLLLQAYATQVTQQWSTQDDEKKELQARIDELERANEQYADELREEIEKTQQDIERYRQSQNQRPQLQISYTAEDDQNVATSTLDSSLVSQNTDDDEYVKKLEEKLNKNKKKLEKYKNAVKSLKSILRSEVEKGNLSNSVLDNLKSLDEVEPISDEQYVHNLENALQKYGNEQKEKSANLNEDEDDKNLNEKTETNLKDTEDTEFHSKANNDKETIEALTNENEHLKEQLKKVHQKAVDKISMMQDAFKKSRASMKQKHKKTKYALIQQNKDLANSLEKSAKKQEEAERKCKEATQELSDIRQKNRQLQIDNKLANAKLISRNEEIKREKSIADSQWKLRQYNLEASTQNQIDKHRREVDEKLSQFLISVCQLFRKYVDVNQTINCDNVLSILSDVAEKLDKYTKQAYEFEKVNDVINFKSGEDPSKKIDQLVKENRKLTSQVRNLSSENGELKKKIKNKDDAIISRAPAKDWEEWAIPLYRKVTNSKATKPTSYILRKGIENALQQALDNNNDNLQAPSSNWPNTVSYNSENGQGESVSIFHLTILTVAAIRLQKMINSFKSNQDLSKTKFKASETHFSGPPVSQKFVRNPYETQNEM